EPAPPPAPPAAPAPAPKPALPKPSDAAPAKAPTIAPIDRDLDAIRAAGTLNVLFTFNSTGYFLYRGETMGYEYELLSMFARDAKLRLKPIVVRDSRELFDRLDRGDGDLVAAQLAAPRGASGATSPAAPVAFTDPLYETAPVVVQRSPKGSEATPSVAKA